ncbi:hypothetical protein ACXYMX_02830 [Sporosarcina sp. CAU 1771]
MRELEFKRFLAESEGIVSKDKAVVSRVSKALKVERDLRVNLDSVVIDDEKMYNLLLQIRTQMNETNGVYQNAVRKYYLFVNGKEFPRMKTYEKSRV